jgi:hypothetical protein
MNEYRSSFINWIDLMTNIWEGEKRRQLGEREEPIPQNTSPSTWRTLFSFRVRTQPPLRRRQSQSSCIQFTAFFTLTVGFRPTPELGLLSMVQQKFSSLANFLFLCSEICVHFLCGFNFHSSINCSFLCCNFFNWFVELLI